MKYITSIIFVLISQMAGLLGSFFTVNSVNTWYTTITKPSFNPPGWVFGPVWIILYTLMGIASYLIWQKRNNSSLTKIALMGLSPNARLGINFQILWKFFLKFTKILEFRTIWHSATVP